MTETTKIQLISIFVLSLGTVALFFSEYSNVESLGLFLLLAITQMLILFNIMRVFSIKSFSNIEKAHYQLQNILNTIPGFVSWINKDLIYLGVNKNLSDFFELEPEDFINKKLGNVTHTDDNAVSKAAEKLFSGDKDHMQIEVSFKKSGKTYWSLLMLQKYNHGHNALLVSIDITKLKKSQAKMKEEETSAIQSGRLASVGEMMATITHEINNPLGVLTTSNKLLTRQVENNKYDQKRMESLIRMNAKALETIDKIISSVKNLVRDGAHDSFEKTSLFALLEDVLIFITKKCQDLNIILNVEKPDNDIQIKCIQVQITQVLLILLNNAVDAVESLDQRWIQVKVTKNIGSITISIIDSGDGIPPKVASKMFDSFYTTKKSGKGTGIGLGLAKKIISSHSGKLKLDKKHPNTKFDITLQDDI